MSQSGINQFQKLLKLRSAFKAVSQLSWSVTQFEKRFPLEVSSDKEIEQLLGAYIEFAKNLKAISDELEEEIDEGKLHKNTK